MSQHTIRLSGRVLEVSEGGDPEGVPVITFHGTPGSRLLYPRHTSDAQRNHIRLIGYNRPGYGGSTPLPGRVVSDSAADATAIADSLGLYRFAVWGFSGGGPSALACAAALPRRVVAASSLGCKAPYPAKGLDWFAGMGQSNVENFQLMRNNKAEWERKNREAADEMLQADRAKLITIFDTLLSDVDREVFLHEFAGYFRKQIQEAFETGIRGVCDDDLATSRSWGFDPASIRVPVQIWHGERDRFRPVSHGRWLASRIPLAEAHFERDEGHLSLFTRRVPEVHRWLAAKF